MANQKPKSAFTLIEVMAAISILAILAIVAYFGYTKAKNYVKKVAAQASVQEIASAIQQLYLDTHRWPAHRDLGCFDDPLILDPATFIDWSYKPFEQFNCEMSTGASPNAPYLELTLPWYGLTGLDCGDDLVCANDCGSQSVCPLNATDRTGNSNEYPGWKGPYLNSVKLDPWGDPSTGKWGYAFEGDYNDVADGKTKSAIQSNGPDRTTGSEEAEADDIVLVTCADLSTGVCPNAWTWR